ncbi:MAG: ATP-binding protein [Sulfurovum sp.]|nr:ATP-binding protein [Sulfurovum sp.]
MRRHGSRKTPTDDNVYVDERSKNIVELWILRILIPLNGHRDFINLSRGFSNDTIAYFLGLDKYVDNYSEEQFKEVFQILKERLETLEELDSVRYAKTLEDNIEKVLKLIQLNSVEKDILVFSIYLKYYELINDATRTLNDLSTDRLIVVLSVLLDHNASSIKSALSPQGKLAQSGLVTVDRRGNYSLASKIEILSDEFADRMMNFDEDIEDMIRDSVRKCTPAQLSVEDFSHLDDDMKLLIPYLDKTIKTQQQGVNILLYGKPGTGKTELTKALAKALGTCIYEVSYADLYDEPITGIRRLKAYKIAQSFFKEKNMILMFDEIEDIVNDGQSTNPFMPPKQSNKGWMNRILETNHIPTIWITNNIYEIDPAIIRRFDMSIEIPIPPKSKRKEIIRKECGELLSEKSIEKIAQHEAIAPALVNRAAKVVNSITQSSTDKDQAFETILNNTLKAQGHTKIPKNIMENLPKTYDASYINTDADLKELAEGIRQHPNARICLYGVPGTGKSAFGKWIAEYTCRPFVLKKGSDLISMWVGRTEQNIADAFNEAREEGAVLVFDEVDSFLQDRRYAKNSWEVTQVNEMLVQMENFNGIFIATTNLMSGLDQASLRRFDMKLEFGYLKPKHAWKLFIEECSGLGIDIAHKEKLQEKMAHMVQLTPGDFAAVRRQHRFRPVKSAEMFLERLIEEVSVKEKSVEAKMGFL